MKLQTNDNPDFFRTVVPSDDRSGGLEKTELIYSTINPKDLPLVLGQYDGAPEILDKIAGDKNLVVHAVDLMIAGPISIPSGKITIYCKTLRVPEGTKKDGQEQPGAVIDVTPQALPVQYRQAFAPKPAASGSGANGDDIAAALRSKTDLEKYGASADIDYSKLGLAGDPGGVIVIVCDELRLEGRLRLIARGGQGRPGANGQAGYKSEGGHAGQGGSGGDGGRIELRYGSADRPERIEVDAGPGYAGSNGKPAAG